jgi:4-hydroxy-2-oxoheptanedioate aldolase
MDDQVGLKMIGKSLKQRLTERGYVLNGYLTIPNAFSAELYARQGWDAVTIDLQHGLVGYESAVHILQALTAIDVSPLVRVPWLEPGLIMKLLDAGAVGITCPMINTADEAERLVRYCKYPPQGERSAGPLRAALVNGSDYIARANDLVNVFAMIETAEAVANVAEITAVDGLDGIYLGPQDLSMSIGKGPRGETLDPAVDAMIERVLQACIAKGLVAGIIAPTPQYAVQMLQRGFRFITLPGDARALMMQAKSWVDGVRGLAAKTKGGEST